MTKAKTSAKDTDVKATKVGKNPFWKQTEDNDITTQATVQAFSSSHVAELDTDSESEQESDQGQLDMDILLKMENDIEWLDSQPQVHSVTLSKFPTAADCPIEIQGFKTESLFDTEA